jgi:hypothetical protein
MKQLLGPLEIRRHLIREELGFRERLVDWLAVKFQRGQPSKLTAPKEGKTVWQHRTKLSSFRSSLS